MKFSLAWADVAAQNTALKIALASVSVTAIILAAGLASASLKDPLIIDRACVTTAAITKSDSRTTGEIQSFIRTALAERFNSQSESTVYLSDEERHFRNEEQKKLKTSGFKQTLIVGDITVKDHEARVDSDRLIAVGDIRSAFRFPLRLQVFQVPRSETNPYGLILDKIEPEKTSSKQDERK